MTVIYHDSILQGTPEWHEARVNKITGSTAYKLLGRAVPTLRSFNSATSTFTGNAATERGHLLEPEAIELYEAVYDVKVQHAGFVTNDKYPNCLYSPDGYLDDRVVEVKCFMPKNHLITVKKPDIKILAQCYFGQIILEKDLTDLVLYCPKDEVELDKKFVVIPVPKKEKVHANMIDKIGKVK